MNFFKKPNVYKNKSKIEKPDYGVLVLVVKTILLTGTGAFLYYIFLPKFKISLNLKNKISENKKKIESYKNEECFPLFDCLIKSKNQSVDCADLLITLKKCIDDENNQN
jgi:hypothetical protein